MFLVVWRELGGICSKGSMAAGRLKTLMHLIFSGLVAVLVRVNQPLQHLWSLG